MFVSTFNVRTMNAQAKINELIYCDHKSINASVDDLALVLSPLSNIALNCVKTISRDRNSERLC